MTLYFNLYFKVGFGSASCFLQQGDRHGVPNPGVFTENTYPAPSNVVKMRLMRDTAKGVEYQHNNGTLHCDIKPDNVLVFSSMKSWSQREAYGLWVEPERELVDDQHDVHKRRWIADEHGAGGVESRTRSLPDVFSFAVTM